MKLIDGLMAVIGILFILAGIICLIVYTRIPDPVFQILVSQLGGILVGGGAVELVIQFIAVRHLVERASSEVLRKLGLSLDAFYENREVLPRWSEELVDTSEVWLAWPTGGKHAAEGVEAISKQANNVRLILTKLGSTTTLDGYAKSVGGEKQKMQADIRWLTQLAQKSGFDVRWFDGPITNSVTIGNPNSTRKGWARIELTLPIIEAGERPSIRVTNRKAENVFSNILKGYRYLWDNSEKPPDGF